MKTRNKLALSCLIAMMALCSFIQAGVVSLANNHKDVGFDFWYVADGSDYAVAPLAKQDNTASYVKSNAGTHEFTTWICGTNKNSADPYSMNYCSNSVRIASENLIDGCQSRVWLQADYADGKISFTAESDALIVKGIVALLIRVLSGHSPQEILDADLYFIEEIGLKEHLSPTRSNGLLAMVKQMRMYALAFKSMG